MVPAEREARLLAWNNPLEIYTIAHRLHYKANDPDAAEPIYRFILARFPDTIEHRNALTQLENIAARRASS